VAQIPSGEMIEVPDSAPFALSGGCSSEPHLRSTPQGTQQGAPWTPATYTPSSTTACLPGPRYWRQRPIIAYRYLFGKRELFLAWPNLRIADDPETTRGWGGTAEQVLQTAVAPRPRRRLDAPIMYFAYTFKYG
jgi:hypothetical protein